MTSIIKVFEWQLPKIRQNACRGICRFNEFKSSSLTSRLRKLIWTHFRMTSQFFVRLFSLVDRLIDFVFVLVFPFQSKQLAPGGRIVSSTADAEQALSNLESLRVNKQYSSLAENIMEAHSFIANPLHSLMEAPQFVVKLVRQLFPNNRALAIVA